MGVKANEGESGKGSGSTLAAGLAGHDKGTCPRSSTNTDHKQCHPFQRTPAPNSPAERQCTVRAQHPAPNAPAGRSPLPGPRLGAALRCVSRPAGWPLPPAAAGRCQLALRQAGTLLPAGCACFPTRRAAQQPVADWPEAAPQELPHPRGESRHMAPAGAVQAPQFQPAGPAGGAAAPPSPSAERHAAGAPPLVRRPGSWDPGLQG